MRVDRIGVCGAGKMGSSIAISCALAGFQVLLEDVTADVLKRARQSIEEQLARMVNKKRISPEEGTAARDRIRTGTEISGFEGVDFVIEAAAESLDLKKRIFSELDTVCRPDAVLVTNTSTFSITAIASATERPERVAGMHFFLPPSGIVEITRGRYTSEASAATVNEVGEKLGRTCINVKKDSPGFIANRIYTPLMLEAFRVYEEGLAGKEEIDRAMTGTYLPVGPFELADIIGLDVILSSLAYYESRLGPQWKPPVSLRELVSAGCLGKKTGKGWYDYSERS